MRKHACLLILLFFGTSWNAVARDIPPRPEQLQFPPLVFEPPSPEPMRVELENGIPVYIAEDHLLPLVTLQVMFRGGQYLEPAGKEGLADLTGEVWRTGGAGSLSPQELDEELDFLAASLSTSIGSTSGAVSLDLLAKDLDRGLELLMQVLTQPRFEASRLAKAKEDLLAAMKERNDSTAAIERREWNRLLYGDDYWLNRLSTKASVESITREDLVAFHARLLNPRDVVVAVAGDFDREAVVAKLNATLGKLAGAESPVPPVPQPQHEPEPGVYLVNKPDVNQGRVSIGHLGLKRPVPDEFAVMLANDVLGGGGFTSWIMSRVRSDEGLAYSAGSRFDIGDEYPGTFRAFFQSKSSTCARAAQIVVELMQKLREQGVENDELETSKNSFIQTFPNRFQTAFQTVSLYASDELVGRPHEYWLTYREKVSAVEPAEVKEAARKYVHPEKLVFLVVGNVDEILKGHPDHPDVKFENFGALHRLPLRDPLTLEPIGE
ncbi:MAG: pitrilysin family protein [Acidobacteriota bacterium]